MAGIHSIIMQDGRIVGRQLLEERLDGVSFGIFVDNDEEGPGRYLCLDCAESSAESARGVTATAHDLVRFGWAAWSATEGPACDRCGMCDDLWEALCYA